MANNQLTIDRATIFYFASGFFIVLYLALNACRYLERRALILKNRCKDGKKYPHKDILGLDFTHEIGKQIAESRRLESLKKLYDKYGSTYSVRLFGQRTIYTIDPENLRAVFAINFRDYGLQPFRLPASMPAIGRNIFTTDGPYWKHSRDQVTPIFTRARISDTSGFEQHFEQMLAKIPRDGSQFDMMPLIEEMVCSPSPSDSTSQMLTRHAVHQLSTRLSFRCFDFKPNCGFRGRKGRISRCI